MGTGRTLNKKPATRPVKSEGERRRRVATQRKRLIALGMPEEQAARLNIAELREKLRLPAKVAKVAAVAAE